MSVVLDPAFRKVLDFLEEHKGEDPDKDLAEVWIAFCKERHIVPVGAKVEKLNFGPWYGPPMLCAEIKVHVKHLRTGREISLTMGWDQEWAFPGDTLTVVWMKVHFD